MMSRRREQFADVFFRRHRRHIVGALVRTVVRLAVSGTLATYTLVPIFAGRGNAILASVATAVFLFFLLSFGVSVRDWFRVRVLPYFECRLGGADTWLAGESLLWHSRVLDEIATACGVTPLSAFASGDDLVPGEELHWFDSGDALRTTERLLDADVAAALPVAVVADLERLRDALRLAVERGVRFCLLVREGSFASGWEMDLRKGSFF
jgi:hypothetical protein